MSAVVETNYGKIRGETVEGIHVFRGIPYGGDTAGKNRFMPPTRPEPWAGVREAVAWGHVAPQPPASGNIDYTRMTAWMEKPGGEGEDCLVLNVYTPGLNDGAKRPVLFSIHGGGYTSGTSGNPAFNGVPLAQYGDVVVVTINHRLGCLGYLHLGDLAPEFPTSGVVGMLDCVAALEWVRDNIERFGGDPGNVMIFGQSGGGGKVCHLMVMPEARGLFHRAAVQSGARVSSATRESANEIAERMLKQIGISKSRVRELKEIPLEMMIGAQAATGARFGPFVDGQVVPSHPFDPTAPETSAEVPLIVGTNLHDFGFTSSDFDLDEEGLRAQASAIFGSAGDHVLAAYRAADPDSSPYLLLARMITDCGTRRNSIAVAERKAALGRAPAYMYLFTWPSAPYGGKFGSVHGTEVPLFFHNVNAWPITGTGPEALAMADKLASAYVSFARTGKPSVPGTGEWPAYTPATRSTMILDLESRIENAPHQELLALVEEHAVEWPGPGKG
jgi:para-nitrobenzyl esterase